MGNISVVPFGPQHPVLPEPIHLDLALEDEKVIEAVPSIGFVHRGLESLIVKKDYNEMVYVAERTCGICSFGHGMGYVEAVEKIMGVQIPDRARYLRTIWMELSRMHSHLLWLGLLADAFGYESLFYHCWRIREQILDMIEESTGGRVIFSVNKVGGVMKDMDAAMLTRFSEKLGEVEDQVIAAEFEPVPVVPTPVKPIDISGAKVSRNARMVTPRSGASHSPAATGTPGMPFPRGLPPFTSPASIWTRCCRSIGRPAIREDRVRPSPADARIHSSRTPPRCADCAQGTPSRRRRRTRAPCR